MSSIESLATPLNNASSVLAVAHAQGSDTLALAAGAGARFGAPTPTAPIRITVASRATLVNGQIAPTSTQTIFLCTARSGDTLSGLTATEGTSDRAYAKSDPVAALITAATISEIQAAAAVAAAFVPPSGAVGAIAVATASAVDYDTNFTFGSGKQTIKCTSNDVFAIYSQDHNTGATYPTNIPWSRAYNGHVRDGVIDNVHSEGWLPGTVPPGYPCWSYNSENIFAPGDPRGPNTLETHKNYKSIDGTVEYRPWSASVYCDTHDYCEEFRVREVHFYHRLGLIPLMLLKTDQGDGTGDGGTVTIANNGTADPLHVISAGAGSMLFQTGETGGFSIQRVDPATAIATTKSSPFWGLNGSVWNGSAAVNTTMIAQIIPSSTSSWSTRWNVGATGFHFWKNNGQVGFNVGGDFYVNHNMVIGAGQYAAVRSDGLGSIPLIGNTNSDLTPVPYIVVDRDSQGTMLGGNVGFNNTPPAAKPTVTGSRGGNAALASLLAALAAMGLITDGTSA